MERLTAEYRKIKEQKNIDRKKVHAVFINILKSENSYPSASSIIDLVKNI